MSVDDIACLRKHLAFHENIDYMSPVAIDDYHLYQCWRQNNSLSIKSHQDDICLIIPSTILKRLENVCWRRWCKNMRSLKELDPIAINWYKDQDITWLYGPKFTGPSKFDISAPTDRLTASNLSKIPAVHVQPPASYQSDDTMVSEKNVLFSCLLDSAVSLMSLDESDSLTDTTVASEEEDVLLSVSDYDDVYMSPTLKSALKEKKTAQLKPAATYPMHKKYARSNRNRRRSSKSVKFNYIINSREIINGMSFDYDFLDLACL